MTDTRTLTPEEIAELRRIAEAATQGPWTAARMTHEDRPDDDLTPIELGEYVSNSVIKSREASGSSAFLFVSAEKADGPADVCHVGNGPTSPQNARHIAAFNPATALRLLALLEQARAALRVAEWSIDDGVSCPVCGGYSHHGHAATCEIAVALYSAGARL